MSKRKSKVSINTKVLFLEKISTKLSGLGFSLVSHPEGKKVKNIKEDLVIHGKKSYGIVGSKFGIKYILKFENSETDMRFGKSKLIWVLTTQNGTKSLRGAKKRKEAIEIKEQKKEMENLQNTINSLGAIYIILWS